MADKKNCIFRYRWDIYCPVGKTNGACVKGSTGGKKKWAQDFDQHRA